MGKWAYILDNWCRAQRLGHDVDPVLSFRAAAVSIPKSPSGRRIGGQIDKGFIVGYATQEPLSVFTLPRWRTAQVYLDGLGTRTMSFFMAAVYCFSSLYELPATHRTAHSVDSPPLSRTTSSG